MDHDACSDLNNGSSYINIHHNFLHALMDGLVVGSHDRNELILISSHGDLKEKPCEQVIKGQVCGICGDKVGETEEGEVFVACNDCAFPICRACYEYERSDGAQVCPQCKTRFKRLKGCARVPGDEEEDGVDDLDHEFGFTSFDHTEFVDSNSEDSSSYGYGRMGWKKRLEKWRKRQELLHRMKLENGGKDMDDGSELGQYQDQDPPLNDEGRLPLSRKLPVSTAQLNPYRMIIIIRFVVLGFFFHYRILHPVNDAYLLWLVSVICEIWFAVSWILDQFPKWLPVNRETYLDRLSLRYEKEGQSLSSQFPSVDIFVTTVDSLKEPPLVTANTILSILAVDYPVDKVSCYISDDGASILTFQALSETCEFARKWVPFCKKFSIEPRAPECYFSEKMDYLKDKVFPEFIKERRAIKREYEEFKVAMNALVARAQKVPDEGWKMQDGTPWPGNNGNDHPGMIQVFLGQSGDHHGKDLPCLMYVSREKRLGFDHHKKAGAMNALVRVSAVVTNAPYILNLDCDHYMNNSKALREAMCFMMDPSTGKKVCYVQFPQILDGTDAYATRNTLFFNINMKGLDGIQGPMYMGTGCVFRRVALYGYRAPKSKKPPGRTCSWWAHHRRNKKSLPKTVFQVEGKDEEGDEGLVSEKSIMKLDHKLGESPLFIASTLVEGGTTNPPTTPLLSEAIHVIGCGYEAKTDWGKEVGWIYGSTTEDMLTGFKIHCRGWRSIYCTPPRPAFKGRAPSNLPNRMHQELRCALGSVEIFFSRQCPVWCGYGRGLKWLERLSYINATLYPFTSIPLLAYCILPAVCLLTQKFIIPEVNNVGSMLFISVFMCVFATCLLEMRWSGVGFREWWRDEQAWVIGGVSARLFAVFQGLLKAAAGIDTDLKWSIAMLVPPTTVLILNLIGVVAGFSSAFSNGYESLGPLLGRLFFAFWVIAHLYPFLKGRLLGFRSRTPTIVVVWSILVASVFSFLWLRIDPFLPTLDGPALEECGLDCI